MSRGIEALLDRQIRRRELARRSDIAADRTRGAPGCGDGCAKALKGSFERERKEVEPC